MMEKKNMVIQTAMFGKIYENIYENILSCAWETQFLAPTNGSTFFVFSNWLPDQQKNPWNLYGA